MLRKTAKGVLHFDGLPGFFFAVFVFILGVTPHFTPKTKLRKGKRDVYLWRMGNIKINSEAAAENPKSAANGATNGAVRLLFDVREAANRLSVSVVSVRKLVRQNRLRRVPDFRKILISESELQKFASQ